MKTKNTLLVLAMLSFLFSCSEENEFTITLKESGKLQVQLLQNGIPITNETVYLIPESVGSKESKSLVQYAIDYIDTDEQGYVDYGEVNTGNYFLATDGIELNYMTYYPVRIAQIVSGGNKSITLEVTEFTGTINLTIVEYDYMTYDYIPVSGVNVAILEESDYYESYNIDDRIENSIDDKKTNSNGEVSYTLPSGNYYVAIIYTKDSYGEVNDYDVEYLSYLDMGEEYNRTISIYFY